MTLRKQVPEKWRVTGRRAYVALGRRTAFLRDLPDFIVIGAQRSGTTSLFRALIQHPWIVRPTFHKGVNYFDVNYLRGPDWYAGHFPISRRSTRPKPLVFEASGYYMFHPLAIERLSADLPEVRIIAMLRDPVERAFSAWKHESARGFEWEDFITALRLEDERLLGEEERMTNDPTYQSFTHRHHAYRHRGDYHKLLVKATSLIPRDRIRIVYSEEFFSDPERQFRAIEEFLDVTHHDGVAFDRYNARPSGTIPEQAHRFLSDYFSEQRSTLEELVDRPAPWPRT